MVSSWGCFNVKTLVKDLVQQKEEIFDEEGIEWNHFVCQYDWSNIDLENMCFNDEKTTQEEKILILFIKKDGLVTNKQLEKYNIARISMSRIIDKYQIEHPTRELYVFYRFQQPTLFNNIDLDEFTYKIISSNKKSVFMFLTITNIIDVDNELVEKFGDVSLLNFKTDQYKSAYTIAIPSNSRDKYESCSTLKIPEENFYLGVLKKYLNEDLYFLIFDENRWFCELVRSSRKLFYTNINDFLSSWEYKYLCEILKENKYDYFIKSASQNDDYNTSSVELLLKYKKENKIHNNLDCILEMRYTSREGFNIDTTKEYAKKLGLYDDVMMIYKFLTTYEIIKKEK